ncbi:unnamed protein product [Camellia sinensis]
MEPLTDKDLKRIEKEMDHIIGRNLPLVRGEVTRDEPQRQIKAISEPYNMEILESIKEVTITIYHIVVMNGGTFVVGPMLSLLGNIDRKSVELKPVAGAYWRGHTNKLMLQRIYGTAWEDEKQLKAYLHFKEVAKHWDHRCLGQDLDLFSIQGRSWWRFGVLASKGGHCKTHNRRCLEKNSHGTWLDLLYIPHVAKADLWKISGHLDFYKENMYDPVKIDEELYQLRPMNCAYHILVYKEAVLL